MKNIHLKLYLLTAASALALLWATPSAHANVYATDIKLNGSLASTVGAGSGVPLTITFRLNQAATYGTTINILSGSTVVRSITNVSPSAGTLQGLNTVTWDGKDGSGNPIVPGTYTVSITAAAADLGSWTQISTSASTAPGLFGVAVNDNPRSPYYGRVFSGNKSGGNCGIRKMNNDLSDADEGALGTCGGYNFHNDGNAPWGIKYAANDQVYFEDWENNGDIYVTDNTCSTNKSVLNNNSSSGNFDDFEVMIIGNGGYILMGDFNFPGIGVYFWPMVNGVASGGGTQLIAPNSTAMLIGDGGLCMDMNTNVYVGQMRTGTDNNPRCFLAGSGPWDGSSKITAAPRWGNGNSDGNADQVYQIAINSRTNPTYVAMAIGGATGYKAGIRVLNAANGTVVTANGGAQVLTNLDSGHAYWGVAFDAVGNLYGCESGTSHLHGFTPPGNNTNTTVAYGSIVISNAPPTITVQPQPSSLTTNQGANLTLTVTASGTPTLAYQWTKNGASLATQTTTSLALASLQAADSGSYAVVVTNLYGAVTSSVVNLTVAAKPVILQQPQPMFTYIGGVAGFSVSVSGSLPLSYQWSHGASQISGATLSSLSLGSVQLTDAGSYTCLITNIYGTTNSSAAVLTVLNPATTDGYANEIVNNPGDGAPIAYYRLDETNGTVAHDIVGGYNGIYNSVALGKAGFSAIDPDTAAGFGPGPGSYVGGIQGISFAAAAGVPQTFSLEAWVNGSATQTSGAGIIAKGNGGGGEQFDLDVYSGKYRFFVRDATGAIPSGYSSVTASVGPNGTWQHVVAVYDGVNDNIVIYVNGIQVTDATLVSPTGVLTSTHEVDIGARQSGSGAYDDNFVGTIDEVALYATALGSGQVYNHYLAQINWPGFAPRVAQQPQPVTVYPQPVNTYVTVTATFAVLAGGDLASTTYQWLQDGNPVAGANDSSYTISGVVPDNAGTYTCGITNSYGGIVSAGALLTVLPTNSYSSAILNEPTLISYWRLDETNGSVAHDWWGNNNGTYNNVTLNQPGYSVADTDPGIALPANPANRGYVQVANYTPFNFPITTVFTFEGWAYFTNLTGVQRLFSTMRTGTSPYGYGFGISGAGELVFTTAGVLDTFQSLTTPLVVNTWYQLVCTCDGFNYYFYVNGQPVGTQAASSNTGAGVPLQFGANPSGWPYPEQVLGRLDEMAIYNYPLSPDQVLAHYTAAPVPAVPVAQTPVVTTGGTNYMGLSATMQENASGLALSYQWYKAPSTLLPGQTASTLTLAPLALTDAGSYYVYVSNGGGSTNTPSAVLTVLPIPTSATDLSLTNGLVLHLPFDGDYKDISGHAHNGTAVGSPGFVSSPVVTPAVGTAALSYSSTIGGPYNYVTLGVVPDLEFGTSTDFSVSYWVQLPPGATYTNLPFFTDADAGNGGFTFAPGVTAGGVDTGGWMWTIGSVSVNAYSTPNYNTINDGNWHHLVHVAQRSANCTTYLDGVQVDSTAIPEAGTTTTALAATIGQDPTGAYPATAGAYLDDLAVWTNTLTSLQVSGIFLAGSVNHVSFAPVVVLAPPPAPATISNLIGATLSYGGGNGSQFVLLSNNIVTAPLSAWTRVATNAAAPTSGSFTIPAVGGASGPVFYSIKSE